jgi:glucokinase
VLEIGGSHVTAGMVAWSAWPPSPVVTATIPIDGQGRKEAILGALVQAAASVPVDGGETWAVAVPDPFDYANGVSLMTNATVGKFEAIYGVSLPRALAPGLGAPAAGMVFVNDADAFGLGEAVVGAAAGVERAVCLTLGTGVGSAFIADGQAVSQGDGVPPLGRINRTDLNGLPFEDVVSARAIRRRFEQAGGVAADVGAIAHLARQGNATAARVFGDAMFDLGTGVGPWCMAFGAQVLVVGGSIAKSWDLIEAPLIEGVRSAEPSLVALPVRRAAGGVDSAMVGAASVVARR